jgi:hypothetical protein
MDKPINTGQFGAGNPGKPKGAVNKTTRAAKEAIACAFEDIGGTERLVAWIEEDKRNEAAFFTSIYPKLVTVTVAGDPDSPISHSVKVTFG